MGRERVPMSSKILSWDKRCTCCATEHPRMSDSALFVCSSFIVTHCNFLSLSLSLSLFVQTIFYIQVQVSSLGQLKLRVTWTSVCVYVCVCVWWGVGGGVVFMLFLIIDTSLSCERSPTFSIVE